MIVDNKSEVVREALRLAELNLTGEVTLMLAADQRATTLSGIVIASVAVIASMYQQDTANWNDDLSLILLAVSAAFASYSARSVKIHIPGNQFMNLNVDIETNRDIILVLKDLGRICDDQSRVNRAQIRKNSKLYNTALVFAVLGFVVGMYQSFFALVERPINYLEALWGF